MQFIYAVRSSVWGVIKNWTMIHNVVNQWTLQARRMLMAASMPCYWRQWRCPDCVFGESIQEKPKAHYREGLSNRYCRNHAVYWQVCITTSRLIKTSVFLRKLIRQKQLFIKAENSLSNRQAISLWFVISAVSFVDLLSLIVSALPLRLTKVFFTEKAWQLRKACNHTWFGSKATSLRMKRPWLSEQAQRICTFCL